MPAIVSTRGLGRRAGIGAGTIRRRAEAMLATAERSEALLSVLLCSDDVIAELNGQYRGKSGPTDVLSFGMSGEPADGGAAPEAPLREPDEPEVLGDVVISVPAAARQAAGSLRDEVTRLLAHGLLHLLGWDHATAKAARAMEAETERLAAAAARRHG